MFRQRHIYDIKEVFFWNQPQTSTYCMFTLHVVTALPGAVMLSGRSPACQEHLVIFLFYFRIWHKCLLRLNWWHLDFGCQRSKSLCPHILSLFCDRETRGVSSRRGRNISGKLIRFSWLMFFQVAVNGHHSKHFYSNNHTHTITHSVNTTILYFIACSSALMAYD